MRIRNNGPARRSYSSYRVNVGSLNKNLEKLSSGYKINRSADDAAGLAISEKMRAQITGLSGAQQNAKQGIGLIQTTEGALQEYHEIVNRMLELSVKSANATYDDDVDREQLQKEMNRLAQELNRIADSTNFNGICTLDGHTESATESVSTTESVDSGMSAEEMALFNQLNRMLENSGAVSGDIEISLLIKGNSSAYFRDLVCLGPGVRVSLDEEIESQGAGTVEGKHDVFGYTEDGYSLSHLYVKNPPSGDYRYVTLPGAKTYTGAVLIKSGSNLQFYPTNKVTGAETEFHYSENANEISFSELETVGSLNENHELTGNLEHPEAIYWTGYNIGENNQNIIGNSSSQSNRETGNIRLLIGETGDEYNFLDVPIFDMHTDKVGLADVDISTQSGALNAIDKIKSAINKVSDVRGTHGALQNRLEHTIHYLGNAHENIQSAESVIRDADMADEMMKYTKNSILTQSAQSMMAQANLLPEGVLRLIQG